MEAYRSLSAAEVKLIAGDYYQERARKAQAVEAPRVVLVGGQPGAGKSKAAELVRDELSRQGGYIHIDADRMRERIPLGGSRPTSQETQADAGRLVQALRTLAVEGKRNVLEEGTYRDSAAAESFLRARRGDGYSVELLAVATPRAQSVLGVYKRHEDQHASQVVNPRMVEESYHDLAMAGFRDTLSRVGHLLDRVRVVDRDGAVLYDSARAENQHASALAALDEGQRLKPERLEAVASDWQTVAAAAAGRGAPKPYQDAVQAHARDAAARLYLRDSALKLAKEHGLTGAALDEAKKQISAMAAAASSVKPMQVVDSSVKTPPVLTPVRSTGSARTPER